MNAKDLIQPAKLFLQTDNMTTRQETIPAVTSLLPDKTELQLLINSIPEFYPGLNLSIFITEVDRLINHLEGRLTPEYKYILDCNIRSKIKGEARDFLSYQDANDWGDIRKCLLQRFGDQRSEDLLVNALSQCVQTTNETTLDYHARILKNFNNLMQNITLNITEPNYLAFKKYEYIKLSVKIFKNGLLEPYRSYLSHFELDSLEDCVNKCHNFDNMQYEWDYCEFLRKAQSNPKIPQKSPQNYFLNQHRPVNRIPPNYNSPRNNVHSNDFIHRRNSEYKQPRRYNTYQQISPQLPPKPMRPPNNYERFPNPASGMYHNLKPNDSQIPTPMSIQTRVNTTQYNRNRPWANTRTSTTKNSNLHNTEINENNTYDTDPYERDTYCENEYLNAESGYDDSNFESQNENEQLEETNNYDRQINFHDRASRTPIT